MASKVKYTVNSDIEKEIKRLGKMSVIAGVCAEEGSHLAMVAGANEFGANIKSKKGSIAIPVQPEFKNKKPSDFPKDYFFLVPGKDGKAPTLRVKDTNEVAFVLVKEVKIPQRAFLRNAADNKKTIDKVHALMRNAYEKLFDGKASAEDVYEAIGSSLVSSIKASIASNTAPENSPLTKRLKGGKNKTLIDSGDLLKSIGFEVLQ